VKSSVGTVDDGAGKTRPNRQTRPFAKDWLLILLRRHLALEEQGVSGQENRFVKPAFRSLSPKAVDNL
jgi:hypothetical protein